MPQTPPISMAFYRHPFLIHPIVSPRPLPWLCLNSIFYSQDGCEGNWGKDGSNRFYGPSSNQINSDQPFHVLATFPTTTGGAGAAFNVRLAQDATREQLLRAASGAAGAGVGRGGLLLDATQSANLPPSRGAVPVSEHDQLLTRAALKHGLVLVASLCVCVPLSTTIHGNLHAPACRT